MMLDNTDNNIITVYNGIEVYKSDVNVLCHEYELQFDNLEDIKHKSVFFTGLVVYINRHLFKNITDRSFNNDYKALNTIFYDCYIPLCMQYNKTPTLQAFCIMVGIDNSILSVIISGTYQDGSRVNSETIKTVKSWKATCEAALIDNGMAGNPVFSIFALKAGHGWKETPQEIQVTGATTQYTPEQIAERFKDAKRPEVPEL